MRVLERVGAFDGDDTSIKKRYRMDRLEWMMEFMGRLWKNSMGKVICVGKK